MPTGTRVADLSNEEILKKVAEHGTHKAAKIFGVSQPALNSRLNRMKNKGVKTPNLKPGPITYDQSALDSPEHIDVGIKDGHAVVFSDAHYWPGPPSTMHRALIRVIKKFEPQTVICNGDAVDMAQASRHPPIGWERRPTVQEEIEASKDRLFEIRSASPKHARFMWDLGNHDARFETKLASVAPEYANVAGIHLHDHFPEWERTWSTWINNDVVIFHRWKGGDHAAWNNTIKSGKTTITGHLHSANVRPFTDLNGTRFGVDTGCLAEIYGKQFNYLESHPRNWVSAFCLLTFVEGKLLWPELVTKWDDKRVQFRGHLIEV